MIAKLPLVPFVIIHLTRLTACVCMKGRFKSKVTRGFCLLAASLWSKEAIIHANINFFLISLIRSSSLCM